MVGHLKTNKAQRLPNPLCTVEGADKCVHNVELMRVAVNLFITQAVYTYYHGMDVCWNYDFLVIG